MQYGTLQPVKLEDTSIKFRGRINMPMSATQTLNGNLQLVENPQKKSNDATDDTPDYIVQMRQRGDAFEAGYAWKKHGDKAGDFLSIALDGPHLIKPVNLSAFAREEDRDGKMVTVFVMTWNRPRGGRVQDEAEASR